MITARGRLRVLVLLCIIALPGAMAGQSPSSGRTTRAGVYTPGQAARGGETYAMSCASCHTPASHAGAVFAARWHGRTLAELYEYIRGSMPKSDPGTLTAREYLQVLAYLLQMNGMPGGPDELPADTTALAKIRIDLPAARDTTRKR